MKTKNKQTKFPVARIKKIMQKDEEVGKVAQATPVVISKALELFLAMIVEEASKVTLERGSKKIEGYHLKHAVETTEMLDFLKEIVESVPDPSAGGTIDLEAEAAEGSKRKRGKTKKNGTAPTTSGEQKKRRKRKVDVDADVDANGAGEEAVGGGKSEQEGDTAMDEDDDRDGYAEPSHRDQDADWRDDEDSPYVPR
ncbi:histone-fold-containing protein [Boletus edulis]|nr:histone-fold-containing protein [Boletus edulis]